MSEERKGATAPGSREREEVTLIGGPFADLVVPVHWGQTAVIEGPPLEEGECARYRPTRERGTYRFREMDRVIGRIELPGKKR